MLNNIWNSIGGLFFGRGGEKQFFRQQQPIQIGTKGAVFIDSWIPYKLYNEIPNLRMVINKKECMFANGVFKLENIKTGEKIPLPEDLALLLENPNALQNQNAWLKQFMAQKSVFGNNFMYRNRSTVLKKYPSALHYLPPSCVNPLLTGKVFDQTSMEGIVSNYEVTDASGKRLYKTADVLWSKVADLDNPITGHSPLKSLKYPISNSKAALDYLNAISAEMGALGVVSQEKDMMGAVPVSKEDKDYFETLHTVEYGKGEGQKKIHLSSAPLKFSPFSYPTQQLLLLEQLDAYTLTIIDLYGLNVNIFSSKAQTYENVAAALRQCYTDTIIVEADSFTQALTPFIGIDPGFKLVLDYSHLSILSNEFKTLPQMVTAMKEAVQGGLVESAQAEQIIANMLSIEVATVKGNQTLNNLNKMSPLVANKVLESMTTNQRLALVGLPPVEGGDTIPVAASFGGGF